MIKLFNILGSIDRNKKINFLNSKDYNWQNGTTNLSSNAMGQPTKMTTVAPTISMNVTTAQGKQTQVSTTSFNSSLLLFH